MSPTDYRRAAEAEAAGIIRERREPLPVEQLISEDQRRVSVAEIDQAAADPIRDHLPQTASRRKINRILAILDELDSQTSNGRFMH